jgi:putative ABC transport system permease protein
MSDLKWAFRKLMRNKSLSLINTLSLVAGICGFLFIFTYCYHQLTYDQYHGDLSSIFRVNSAWISNDDESLMTITPGTISGDLKQKHPFVDAVGYVKLIDHNPQVSYQNNSFETKHFYPGNHGLLGVFRFDFIDGNKSEALSGPRQVILSDVYAQKIFGKVNCIGELIEIKEKSYEVVGVFENWPSNLDFKINGVFSDGKIPTAHDQFAYRTFVKTVDGEKEDDLYRALIFLSETYYENTNEGQGNIIFRPQAFQGLHFEESLQFDTPKGKLYFVYMYLLTGLILFIIVLTNQINLNFVRNADLVKTFGIIRILGSNKWRVKYQNILENFLIFLAAILLSFIAFHYIIKTRVDVNTFLLEDLLEHPFVIASIILFYFIVTFIIALLTTSISLNNNLASALRKEITKNLPNARFRNYLVLFQYSVGIILVTTLLILYLQWDYIQNKDLGFQTDNIHVVDIASKGDNTDTYYTFTDLFGSENVSTTPIGGPDISFSTLSFPEKEHGDINASAIYADPTFFDIMNIQLLHGLFPPQTKEFNFENGNRMPILINETMADKVENPIGTSITIDGWYQGRIDGVFKDFHYESLHNRIEPLIIIPSKLNFRSGPDNMMSFIIRSTQEKSEIHSMIEDRLVSADAFQLTSITNKILENYAQEQQAVKLLGIFSGVSIFVAFLGIMGILMYSMKKRKFEIGIRKILGANLLDLVLLFNSKTMLMVGISVVISTPAILFIRNLFLEQYAYKIKIGFLLLLIPGSLIAMITFLLIYGLVKHSSAVNPAQLVREE